MADKIKAIPEGIRSLTPHLSVAGCAEAIEFWKKAFGAEEVMRAPDPSGKKIWHAMIRIGDSVFFCNDTFPEQGMGDAQPASLWIYGEDVDGRFKRAKDAGATVKMPPDDMFWGDRMAQVTDKWGNSWTLAQHVRDMSPDDMKKAEQEFLAHQK